LYNLFKLRPEEPEEYICKIRVVILVSSIEEKFGAYRNRHTEMQAVNIRWARSRYTVYSTVLLYTYFWPTLYLAVSYRKWPSSCKQLKKENSCRTVGPRPIPVENAFHPITELGPRNITCSTEI